MPDLAPFDPELLVRTLARHRVEYVLIGALAARMFGFPRVTADADITPSRNSDNMDRLAASLRDLDAKIYTEAIPEGLAFDCSPAMLGRADAWNLITRAGRVDVMFAPAGTGGFAELAQSAVRFEVFEQHLLVARLEDILRSKEAANRPKDRQDAMLIRAMLRNPPDS